MAGFGSLAPDQGAENDLLSQPDWREQEAQAGLAAQQEAQRPSGLSTLWSAIKHPSLYPMVSGMVAAEEAPKPAPRTDLPDVGQPLVSPGPQISSGTRLGRAISGQLPEAVAGAIKSGATAPGRAAAGEIPMWGPTGHTSEEMVQAGSDVAALAGGASVAGTLERAATEPGLNLRVLGKRLASDTGGPGAAVSIAEHAPQYTTGIEGALSRIPSNELTAPQWLNQLKRYGAKPEELEWRQLGPALEGLGNAKISKAGIEEHLANNPVQLNRKEMATPPERFEDLTPEQQQRITDIAARSARNQNLDVYDVDPAQHYRFMREDDLLPSNLFPPPRYPSYTLPGAENYRERLITLPGEQRKFGIFHQGQRIVPEMEFNSGVEARNWAMDAQYPDALNPEPRIPPDSTVRQINDPKQFTSEQGSHWDEPNVLFHRRSTDRYFPQDLTPEQHATNARHDAMTMQADDLYRQQGEVGRQLREIRGVADATGRRAIFDDMNSGRITRQEANARLKGLDETETPGIKPLQDKLVDLRRQEDEIRRNMPEQHEPQQIRSLHDEENQSDWHQQGRDKGYAGKEPFPEDAEVYRPFPDSYPNHWAWRRPSGEASPAHFIANNAEQARQLAEIDWRKGSGKIPNAPFKGSGWERLALHDQLREAAEKGYPRISWTAGEENPTNPLTMMRNGGRELSELSPDRQAEVLRADRGIRDYYNRRRVDQANKIGKAHGVQVERSSIPADEHMTLREAMARLGVGPEHEARLREQFGYAPTPVEIPSGELKGQKLTVSQFVGAAKRKGLATYHMDIPDSLRRELLTKPMSLFEDTGEAGKAAAIARQVEQKTPTYDNWHDALEGRESGTEAAAGPAAAPAARGSGGVDQEPRTGEPGGDGGRDARVAAAQAQATRVAGKHTPLPGLPVKELPVGDSLYIPGPIGKVKDVAESYMRGRPKSSYHTEPEKYHPLDEEHSRNIAKAFEDMAHEPDNPAVKASYDALYDETRQQYRHIRQMHPELKIEPITGADPYAATPRLAARDVGENNHLWFFPTEGGFGTGEQAGISMADHPAMRPSGETLNGRPLLNNDLFRIVHDYFGHLKEGYGFRAAGEDNAWRSHAAMYSDLARPAMTTETRGQNSWVNYGPHAEANRTASAGDTVYADQKLGLMPEWTMRDRNSPAPIISYQGSPSAHRYVDMSKIGTGEGSGVRGTGMYSAGHEPIAEWYRHQLAARHDPLLKKYKLSQDHGSNLGIDLANSRGDPRPVIEDLQDHIESLKAQQAQGDTSTMVSSQIRNSQNMIRYLNDPNRFKGHMYQFAIDRPPEHFIDWDKPLSQQSDYVKDKLQPMVESMDKRIMAARTHLLGRAKERLAKAPPGSVNQRLEADIKRYSQPVDWENTPGKKLYEMAAHEALGTPPLNMEQGYPISSQYLRNKGIAGVKYESGTIHKQHQGQTNYATFEAPRILKRYAIPGMLGAGVAGTALAGKGENGS